MNRLPAIKVKRIYEPATSADGFRILIDRLWPRGILKTGSGIDVWCKDVAPSTELRRWFHSKPDEWNEFVIRYQNELRGSTAVTELIKMIGNRAIVTLLYASKSTERNHALVLKEFIEDEYKKALAGTTL